MEIKGLNGVIGAYKANKPTKPINKENASTVRTSTNLDRIEFDFARSLEAAKTNIAAEVTSETAPAVLDKIKEQLSDGKLNITSDELASIIASF